MRCVLAAHHCSPGFPLPFISEKIHKISHSAVDFDQRAILYIIYDRGGVVLSSAEMDVKDFHSGEMVDALK